MNRFLLAGLLSLTLLAPAGAQPAFAQPKSFPPDADTLKQIEAKTADLRQAVAGLPKDTADDVRADVEVYLKAAEWIVRHGEWFTKDSAKQTATVLDAGLARAKAAAAGKTPWRDVRGRPVIRGYPSWVDGSVQPFSVTLPPGYGTGDKKWRVDIVLHGRDQTLTEVKFINARETAKPPAQMPEFVVIEPYGRGNNAYRWAGENDVFSTLSAIEYPETIRTNGDTWLDERRKVLRGFSMGGAGTWHLGLHHPFDFNVIGPGAGFTTTHGYIRNLPPKLPGYVEACLHIYDAVDYAENAFDVPVVAYSGEKDPQKAAADTIEAALKGFKEPVRFTHLVAPGLEHRMPPEWQAKAEAEYRKYADRPRTVPDHVRFVTYTARYGDFGYGEVYGLDRHYEKAVVEVRRTPGQLAITTSNVRSFFLNHSEFQPKVVVDGQTFTFDFKPRQPDDGWKPTVFVKTGGKWAVQSEEEWQAAFLKRPEKGHLLRGPIDDAFMDEFRVVGPTGEGWHPAVTAHAAASMARFGREWDKYFRGRLPEVTAEEAFPKGRPPGTLVLFGDPGSNPVIAKVVEKLPIKWTRDVLEVNGVRYDPKGHVPVLICPNPLAPNRAIVINSGHTFHEADLKGTNALLYPRLGDWAVLKAAPTEKDPAATEVVAAGLFDEFWQFPKK